MPESDPQWTPIGEIHGDGTSQPYLPTVVASVWPDTGRRAYVFGWARTVVHESNREVQFVGPMDRAFGQWEHTTTIEWASEPRRVHHYPTAGDWSRDREVAQAASPDAVLADPLVLTVGT